MSKVLKLICILLFLQGNAQLISLTTYPGTGLKPADLGLSPSDMKLYNDPELQYTEPFKVFDNLYYIGNKWVSMYLMTTSEGLVLIDALFGKHVAVGIENVVKLGFNPAEIKYVIVTHGHFDHVAGAETFQRKYGARIIMTGADWERTYIDQSNPVAPFEAPKPDLLAKDGDSLRLGNTCIRFYETPGHTEGVLSMEFMVNDGPYKYRAFVFGGVGLNFSGVARTKMYLNSVDRILALAEEPQPVSVNVANHPGINNLLTQRDAIRAHVAGHHPMVAPEAFRNWLIALKKAAFEKLKEEEKPSLKGG